MTLNECEMYLLFDAGTDLPSPFDIAFIYLSLTT